jgi:hypothetical protein
MNTILIRHIKRIQVSVLDIESSLYSINTSIQAFNQASQLVGLDSNIKTIPTRAQILNRFSNVKDPELLIITKRIVITQLNKLVNTINGFKNWIDPAQKRLDEIIVYIEIGKQYISLFRTLANLLNILIKGLRLALVPLIGLVPLPIGSITERIIKIITKIEDFVEKIFGTIDTWLKWIEEFVDKTLTTIADIISDIYSFINSLINRIKAIIAFINSLSVDLLKALLGIIPKDKNQILSEYADIIDNNPDPEIEDQPTTNGNIEDIEEVISTNDGGGGLPPDYYSDITLQQITRLKFILEKQRNKDEQKTNDYKKKFIEDPIVTDIINQLYLIRQQIENDVSLLSQEDIEYLSLLKEYGIDIELEPALEETYSLDKQISSLEEAEAELRRRAVQQLTNENIRTDAEYEEYGKNRDNAVITYRRKTL